MSIEHGIASPIEPVDKSETLFRRVPLDWYDPESKLVAAVAYRPREDDVDGLSVTRAKSTLHPDFHSVTEAAKGRKPYYVAVLSAEQLMSHEMTVVPAPIDGNPGHAIIPEITYSLRKVPRVQGLIQLLAERLTMRVEGPFLVVGP